jgi:hypothetical protein
MDIFSAVVQVKKGKKCKTMLGDTQYILFRRITVNYNDHPLRPKKVLGVQTTKNGRVTSCVALDPVVMCHTDWELCEIDENNDPWNIMMRGQGIKGIG